MKKSCHSSFVNRNLCLPLHREKPSKDIPYVEQHQGRMVEWSITPVLKTGARRRAGGSNPSPSATNFKGSVMTLPFL